jgi:hypothetical protein
MSPRLVRVQLSVQDQQRTWPVWRQSVFQLSLATGSIISHCRKNLVVISLQRSLLGSRFGSEPLFGFLL